MADEWTDDEIEAMVNAVSPHDINRNGNSLNDDRLYVAISKALVAAALIWTVIYGWSVLAGDTGMGGM